MKKFATFEGLQDLWAIQGNSESDVLAVGFSGTVMDYDGATWNNIESGTNFWLQDIWSFSETDAIAVGENGIILRYKP